jgi:hypothetical protein
MKLATFTENHRRRIGIRVETAGVGATESICETTIL